MLDSWQIGEIKVTRILEMEMPLPYRADNAFMPKATPEAIKKIKINTYPMVELRKLLNSLK